MKAKKETVEAAILTLVNQITETMPGTMYKFLLGGATAFATLKSNDKIRKILDHVSDESGLVDVDLLEKMIDGAFKASDGKVQLELFNKPGLLNMFVKPITLTITREDVNKILDGIKDNSVS